MKSLLNNKKISQCSPTTSCVSILLPYGHDVVATFPGFLPFVHVKLGPGNEANDVVHNIISLEF